MRSAASVRPWRESAKGWAGAVEEVCRNVCGCPLAYRVPRPPASTTSLLSVTPSSCASSLLVGRRDACRAHASSPLLFLFCVLASRTTCFPLAHVTSLSACRHPLRLARSQRHLVARCSRIACRAPAPFSSSLPTRFVHRSRSSHSCFRLVRLSATS